MARSKKDIPRDLNGYDPVATARPGDRFDWDAAEHAADFVESCCVHVKGDLAGQPLTLEKWQRDLYWTLFGWKGTDGRRRYRRALLEVPRKNSKTTHFGSPIALYMTGCDGELGGEVYSFASKEEQAAIVWRIAAMMVRKSERLRRHFQVLDSTLRILHPASGSFYAAIPADAKGAHGTNPSCFICDELHVVDRDMVTAMEGGTISRRAATEIYTTTAGNERDSVWFDKHEYAAKVRAGSQMPAKKRSTDATAIDDPTYLPVLYGASAEDDWTDPKTWAKANPNLGKSVREDKLADLVKEAKHFPLKQQDFQRYHLNLFVEALTTWITPAVWDACCDTAFPDLTGRPCYGGLDLSSSRDLASFVLVFPVDGIYYVKCWAFCPPERLREAEGETRAPYTAWKRDGHLIASENELHFTDYRLIEETAAQAGQRYQIVEVGFDKWNATSSANNLAAHGITMVEVPQTARGLNEAVKRFDELVPTKQVRHDGHPVLAWNVGNMAVLTDRNGNRRPVRRGNDARNKIDCGVALLMALSRAIVSAPPAASKYESEGIFVLG